MSETNYEFKAREDAKDILRENMEELVDCVVVNSCVVMPKDFDKIEWHDKVFEWLSSEEFSLSEAADVLEQLARYQETDSGLWQGQEPIEAVKAQAFYTYKNAVESYITTCLKDIADIDFESAATENKDGDEEYNRDEIEKLIEDEL